MIFWLHTLRETCAFSQLNNFVPTGKMWWSSFSYFRKMCGFTRDHFFLLGETDWVGKWCLSHQSCSLFMQHKTTPNKTRFDLKVSLHAFKLSANRFMSRKIGYLSTFDNGTSRASHVVNYQTVVNGKQQTGEVYMPEHHAKTLEKRPTEVVVYKGLKTKSVHN